MKTVDFLDAIRERYQLTSDYKLAKLLGITVQRVSMYRRGSRRFDNQMAVKAAELLGLNAIQVIACVELEREMRPELRKVWEGVAGRLCIMLSHLLLLGTPRAPLP